MDALCTQPPDLDTTDPDDPEATEPHWHIVSRTVPRNDDGRPAVSVEVWSEHVRYACEPDRKVLDRLTAEYRGYALALARRLHRDGESIEDLNQVALLALCSALQRFDPERSIPFPAFATPTIVGALRRHYRDNGWALRVPRRVHEIATPAREAADRLSNQLGRTPTVTEVAAELGVSTELLLEAQEALHARHTRSLDTPSPGGDDEAPVLDPGARDPGFVDAENRIALHRALRKLDAADRELLGLYFFEELTQSEIGRRYGVSQMQISRLLGQTLRRLRTQMDPDADAA